MPTWTIISPCEDDYDHPMRMNIFRVMKTVYRMLDSPNEPSTVGEGKHIATLGYAGSQEKPGPPDLSSLVIHFRLSTQTVTHFVVVFCDQQIEDRVQNVCISVPCELTPIMTDIYEFVAARSISSRGLNPAEECDLAHRIWKQLQVEKYHKRLLQQGVVSDIDIAFSRPGSPRCPICDSNLIHCNSCQVASCESNECRGSSEPPLARCSRHQKEALCFPCLEEQESQPEIEKCPGCKSWCCTMDMSLCSGHPINVLPILRIPGSESIPPGLIVAYTQSARAHPPKRGSCMECELPGWRSCNSNLCWSHTICPECASSGMTCLCQEVWACDLCAEYNPGVFIRCPRCNRPFCCACSYIEECQQCHRTNLCYDCAEEESGGNDEATVEFPRFVASCGNCRARVCDRCVLQWSPANSCPGCLRQLCPSCYSLCDECKQFIDHDDSGFSSEDTDISIDV